MLLSQENSQERRARSTATTKYLLDGMYSCWQLAHKLIQIVHLRQCLHVTTLRQATSLNSNQRKRKQRFHTHMEVSIGSPSHRLCHVLHLMHGSLAASQGMNICRVDSLQQDTGVSIANACSVTKPTELTKKTKWFAHTKIAALQQTTIRLPHNSVVLPVMAITCISKHHITKTPISTTKHEAAQAKAIASDCRGTDWKQVRSVQRPVPCSWSWLTVVTCDNVLCEPAAWCTLSMRQSMKNIPMATRQPVSWDTLCKKPLRASVMNAVCAARVVLEWFCDLGEMDNPDQRLPERHLMNVVTRTIVFRGPFRRKGTIPFVRNLSLCVHRVPDGL